MKKPKSINGSEIEDLDKELSQEKAKGENGA